MLLTNGGHFLLTSYPFPVQLLHHSSLGARTQPMTSSLDPTLTHHAHLHCQWKASPPMLARQSPRGKLSLSWDLAHVLARGNESLLQGRCWPLLCLQYMGASLFPQPPLCLAFCLLSCCKSPLGFDTIYFPHPRSKSEPDHQHTRLLSL